MSIGETLAQARREAGLSIADVSSRTRIKLSIVDDIEHDDYSACGGDHRARDTIAEIARTVGVDAGPLIEAYAAGRPDEWIAARSSEPISAAQAPEDLTPSPAPEPPAPPAPEPPEPERAGANDDTQPIPLSRPPEPVWASDEAEPVPASDPAGPLPASGETTPLPIDDEPFPIDDDEPFLPRDETGPLLPDEPADLLTPVETALPAWAFRPAKPPGPRLAPSGQIPSIWIVLGAAVLAFAALGGILLVTSASAPTAPHSVSARPPGHPSRTRPSPRHSARPPHRTQRATPASSRSARALVPASITAFGPSGAGQGDSPELARQALADKAAAPWHSAWYTTSRFGNLESGTGLLLDMGRKVTITSARIALGNDPGADVALRVGNAPDLSSMSPVAHANDAAGLIRLRTAKVEGRYVLVWFTKLPVDQTGTYQVSVYDIKLRGYP